MDRVTIAQRYLTGSGLEIGARHSPWPVPATTRVVHVDLRTRDELVAEDPALPSERMIHPDLVEDGATLPSIGPRSQDFVVSSHVLEHMPDPIGALRRWARVTRPGGHVVIAVPDKRECFDRDRRVTPYYELRAAHETGDEGVEDFKRRQLADWGEAIEGLAGAALDRWVAEQLAAGAHVHFAVWDFEAFVGFLGAEQHHAGFKIRAVEKTGHEIFAVLEVC